MQELEKRALAELQRVKSIEDAEKRFQEEAKHKYDALITQLEQSWKLEISNRLPTSPSSSLSSHLSLVSNRRNRERQLDERYKEHYEALLAAKDEQLAIAVDVNHSADHAERERWAYAMETMQNKHNAVFYDLEEKMKVKYPKKRV